MRGIGPTLASFGVTDALADPQLKLFDSGNVQIDLNDDWGGASLLTTTFSQLGAFALAHTSKDATLLKSLTPGVYSAHATTAASTTGTALVEVYDADGPVPATTLVNISARGPVGTGDNILIAGFVVTGNSPKTLLVRGVGPSLAPFGVTGVLTDPFLRVFRFTNQIPTQISSNDNWGGGAALQQAFNTTGAFNLISAASKDAALLLTVSPGVIPPKSRA